MSILFIISPESLSLSSLSSLMDQASILLLLAAAQCFMIIMGRIDLANAAFCSLLTVLSALISNSLGFQAIPLLFLFAIAIGLMHASIHLVFQIPSFIVSLAFLGISSGSALVLTGASTIIVEPEELFIKGIFSSPFGLPASFLSCSVIVGILAILLVKTPWGRAIRAIGFNQRATTYSGINTFWIICSAYVVSSLLIALAAVLTIGQLGTASTKIADSYLLLGVASVIIGGTSITGGLGGLGRTIWGVLIISILRVGMDILKIDQNVQPLVYGVVIIIAIATTVDRSRTSPIV